MKNERGINWPSRDLILPWLAGLAVVLLAAVVFADLAEDVWFREGFAWDAPVILAIHQLSSPWMTTLMQAATWSGETGAILLAIGLALWFLWQRRPVDTAAILLVFGGAIVLSSLIKFVLARPRPALFTPLVVETGFSFPSTHVTASTAVFGFLAVMLWRSRHPLWALLSAAWVLVVAASRIYLGVHYPSDALAAILFSSLLLVVIFGVRDWYLGREMLKAVPHPAEVG